MFALVIAPALKTALHTGTGYESFVAIGPTAMAGLSIEVVLAFALLLTAASIRVFSRSAVR
jgi:hypothetical protein